jgi:hypothetical protein
MAKTVVDVPQGFRSASQPHGRPGGRLLLAGLLLSGLSLAAACDGCAPPPSIEEENVPFVDLDDIDGDGIRNGLDEDMDGDGIPNIFDDDVDGDGIPNDQDPTPYGESPNQTGPYGDIDRDGIPNYLDNDDDGDGIPDGVRGIGSCDGGRTTAASEDSDCDGFCLSLEGGYIACDDGAPPGSGQPDSDGDGIPDSIDPDDDNDGIPDVDDVNPNGVDPDPVGPANCTTATFTTGADVLPPRILLVVDKSGSMNDPAAGFAGSKWDATRTALNGVLASLDGSIEAGLMLYPNGDADSNVCRQGNIRVGVAANNAGAIRNVLNGTAPGGGTPTAATLTQALSALSQLSDEGGPRAVVLATDGGPNCNGSLNGSTCRCVAPNQQQCRDFAQNCLDDANAIAAASQLNGAGFPVFVVGIPGSENFTDVLNSLANAGGTAQAGATAFYGATSSNDLATAIEDIAVRVGGCRFDLPQNVTPADVSVQVDGRDVARDTSRQNGWDLVDPNTVELFGVPCQEAVNGGAGVAAVAIQICLG